MVNRNLKALAVAVALLALAGPALAQNPAATIITIPDMHCAGCAKRIEGKLLEVQGVATLQTNVDAKTITVLPRPRMVLSPRQLWEAVEKANKHPNRLQGPSGTFTAKPQA